MARVGAALQTRLDARVLGAILRRSVSAADRSSPATGQRDVETLQRFASGTAPFAFFDAPWTPVFLFALFTFHWMLGVLAVASGVLLFGIAILNQVRTKKLEAEAGLAAAGAGHFAELVRAGGETVRGLGMQDAVVARSGRLRSAVLDRSLAAADRNGYYRAVTRTLRLFLQSMMLALAAWLVILDILTPGMMIASSILLGRALAPIDQAVGQWPMLATRRSRVAFPRRPAGRDAAGCEADATARTRGAAGGAGAHGGSPGDADSRGARRVVPAGAGVRRRASPVRRRRANRRWPVRWPACGPRPAAPSASTARSWTSTTRRCSAPHRVSAAGGGAVRRDGGGEHCAARTRAGCRSGDRRGQAHRRPRDGPAPAGRVRFPGGGGRAALSGGQRQRIALARAFYGSPVVVVMDEPDSNLDSAGTMALAGAVKVQKARGGSAVIVAHRPGAFAQCDTVYLMESGRPVPASAKQKGPVRTLEPGARNPPARTVGGGPKERPPKAEGAASGPRPVKPSPRAARPVRTEGA